MSQYNLDHGRKRAFALMIPNIHMACWSFMQFIATSLGWILWLVTFLVCGQFKNVAVKRTCRSGVHPPTAQPQPHQLPRKFAFPLSG